jgi:hypothetical protein
MTAIQIKEMFKLGEQWEVYNSASEMNTGLECRNGTLSVLKTYDTYFSLALEDATGSIRSDFPKASQIIKAEDGFLKYRLDAPGSSDFVTFRRVTAGTSKTLSDTEITPRGIYIRACKNDTILKRLKNYIPLEH